MTAYWRQSPHAARRPYLRTTPPATCCLPHDAPTPNCCAAAAAHPCPAASHHFKPTLASNARSKGGASSGRGSNGPTEWERGDQTAGGKGWCVGEVIADEEKQAGGGQDGAAAVAREEERAREGRGERQGTVAAGVSGGAGWVGIFGFSRKPLTFRLSERRPIFPFFPSTYKIL